MFSSLLVTHIQHNHFATTVINFHPCLLIMIFGFMEVYICVCVDKIVGCHIRYLYLLEIGLKLCIVSCLSD